MTKMKTIIQFCFFFIFMNQIALSQSYKGDKLEFDLLKSIEPGKIDIIWNSGSVKVVGHTGKKVSIEVVTIKDGNEKNDASVQMKGMRKTLSSSEELQIERSGNNFIVHNFKINSIINLVILVPNDLALKIKSLKKCDIFIENFSSSIEVSSFEGLVSMKNISGSVVASTVKGSLSTQFASLSSENPSALSTLSGNINVTIPQSSRCDLKIKSGLGNLQSNFDIGISKNKEYNYNEWMTSKLNGGGASFSISCFKGDIFVNSKKS